MDLLQYVDLHSFMNKMDPCTKFFFFIAIAVMTSFTRSGPALLLILAFMVCLWAGSGILKHMLFLVQKIKVLLIFIILLWLVMGAFSKDPGPVIFSAGSISLEWFDLYKGLVLGLRIFLMIGSFYTVILTTNFSEIIVGLRKIHVPYSVAFGIGLIFQMIPIITGEFHSIIQAQSSRGLEVEKCGAVKKIKNYITVSMPLLFRVIGKGQSISLAMYYYSLDFKVKRTSYKTTKATYKDFLLLAGTAAVIVLAVLIGLWLPGLGV